MSFSVVQIDLHDETRPDETPLQKTVRAGLTDGFLAVTDSTFPENLHDRMNEMTKAAFEWPDEVKRSVSKSVSSHFLGYTAVGGEKTNNCIDQREIFDFAMEGGRTKDGDTAIDEQNYMVLEGSNQWPDSQIVGPTFRATVEEYLVAMRKVYRAFLRRLEEELLLPPHCLQDLDTPSAHHRLKLVKYFPQTHEDDRPDAQGVGAHQDETGWLTFVKEVDRPGLQLHLRTESKWETVLLQKDAWGLNIGKAFERATAGLVHATLHRVQSPPAGYPPRHSIIFFAGLPLSQTYASLREIFMQSSVLKSVENRSDVSSDCYLAELNKLVGMNDPGVTFGDTQLSMWKRSYDLSHTG